MNSLFQRHKFKNDPRISAEDKATWKRVNAAKWKGNLLGSLLLMATGGIVVGGTFDFWRRQFFRLKDGVSIRLNHEAEGIYKNPDREARSEWAVAIYNGSAPSLAGLGSLPGGLEFSRVGQNPIFTHRINSFSPARTTQLLRQFRHEAMRAGKKVRMIGVLDHSGPAAPRVGGVLGAPFFTEVARMRKDCGTQELRFLGCSVAEGPVGDAYIGVVATYCGMEVGGFNTTTRSSDARNGGRLTYPEPDGKLVLAEPYSDEEPLEQESSQRAAPKQ